MGEYYHDCSPSLADLYTQPDTLLKIKDTAPQQITHPLNDRDYPTSFEVNSLEEPRALE